MARLGRPLRRTLLEIMQGFDGDALAEDMLRHREYWVWMGEFLHPHEYAKRFPKVARAFLIVRGQDPHGREAPEFRTWYSRMERVLASRDVAEILSLLLERPGEFVRRFDQVLRGAANDADRDSVLVALTANLARFATPVLLTLKAHLPTRTRKAGVRVYWPKGRVARGVSAPDER